MKKKPITPREIARRDVDEAMDYYTDEAGLDVAYHFSDAVRAAYDAIAERPAAGSPRHGQSMKMAGLRSRAVKRFPYLIFYVEHEDLIEIRRVLHAQRDIPVQLRDNE